MTLLTHTPPPFEPPFWLANAHLQTILPKFLMPKVPVYRRELVKDSLNESDVAFDFYDASNDTPTVNGQFDRPLVVLFHGMEGSSQSHYARTLAHQMHELGWHYVVAHFRSCGGVPARGQVFYDAGDTGEVHHVLSHLAQRYPTIYAIGTSLGGNVIAKYLGEYGDDALCAAAVAVSSPLDLASASIAMERFMGRKIYTPYLLNPVIAKALANNLSEDELRGIKASRKLSEFDDVFTAPRHGFKSKNEYYRQASALPYLLHINKPTLIINAQDDPFLGVTPTRGDLSPAVRHYQPKHGGHIGFLGWQDRRFDLGWLGRTAAGFFGAV